MPGHVTSEVPTIALTAMDVAAVVKAMPRALRQVLEDNPGTVLAGGSIRSVILGEKVNDWDLFVRDQAHGKDLSLKLQVALDTQKVFRTKNAVSLDSKLSRAPVQVITRWTYAQPRDLLASFDYTMACAAIWHDGKRWQSLAHGQYYADLAARRLVYLSPVREEEPGGSMLRLLKYTARGWKATLQSVASVAERWASGVRGWDSLPPEGRANLLKALLVEVDPNNAWNLPDEAAVPGDEDTPQAAGPRADTEPEAQGADTPF